MLKNYLITALNDLLKNKLFTFINLVGLAIGLASTILIGLFVADELSYDSHYRDADRLYRVSRDFPADNLFVAANAPQVAQLLKQDFSDIEESARLFGGQALLSRENTAFYEDDVRFADHVLLRIFEFDWLAGDPGQALARPGSVVLTESIATKYFGQAQVLGQTLMLDREIPLEVTGIIRDLPLNTHLDIGVMVSMPTVLPITGTEFFEDWANNTFYTYIKLKPGADIEALAAQFPAFLERHFREGSSAQHAMRAMAVQDIHLHSTLQNEMLPPGSITNVYVFSAIALVILLIACFNFMNLSTARASRRGREVGVRKALGASRSQVARQFVGESVLTTVLACVLALVLVELVLPHFNGFLGKQLSLELTGHLRIPAALVALVTMVGLVAGSYPAFFLSAFKPTLVLRGVLATGGSLLLRNVLVIVQFSIAIVLVVATFVMIQQMRFAQDFELGFQREKVVILHGPPTAGLGPQWEAMRDELLRDPGVTGVTASGKTPLQANSNSLVARAEGADEGLVLPFIKVDFDFFSSYDIPVLAGRGFSRDYPNDRFSLNTGGQQTEGSGFVLNRGAAQRYGWSPEEAVGKELYIYFGGAFHTGTVVGVVEDSQFESVRSTIKPLIFIMPDYIEDNVASMPLASIRLSGTNEAQALAHIDAVWQKFMPDFPVVRHFLDEDFDVLYQSETRQGQLFYYFAMLAIFIACMGLYGLASFNAERRTKEIGVRKVMGSSVWSIVLLLTNDFSRLVLTSNVIAWPVAYLAMDRWLQNFAYRVDLTPVIFIGSGLIALSIAWVTVGGTAAKAAAAKPVLALRYE